MGSRSCYTNSSRIPEEEFKFQKKITTEDGRLKISTETYEDVQ